MALAAQSNRVEPFVAFAGSPLVRPMINELQSLVCWR